MKKLDKKELKEIIQSGHLNLLVGCGCSLDYLSTLKDIENRMNVEETREESQKDYFKQIKISKAILKDLLVNLSREKDLINFFSEEEKRESIFKYDSNSGTLSLTILDFRMQEKEDLMKIFDNQDDIIQIDNLFKLVKTKQNYD